MRSAKPLLWVVLATLTVIGASCQRKATPVGVSGSVTLDGNQVAKGFVLFEPRDSETGQVRQAAIENGAFNLPSSQGILPGVEYRVIIKVFRKTGRKYANADMAASDDEYEQYLPAEYNSNSTLKVTPSARETDNRYTFELATPVP